MSSSTSSRSAAVSKVDKYYLKRKGETDSDAEERHAKDEDAEYVAKTRALTRKPVKGTGAPRTLSEGQKRWMDHVKKTMKDHSCTYSKALSLAKTTYRKP